MSKRNDRTQLEMEMKAFLANGGKVKQLPPSRQRSLREIEAEAEGRRLLDKRMRDAENRRGCYSPYYGVTE